MNTPDVRFNSFSNTWEKRKLNELLTQRIEHQTITEEAPLLAFSYAEGVIDPEDKKSNKRDFLMTDKGNKIFSRTEKEDIIYNPANVIHGAIHRNKLKTGVVSPIYKIFSCNENISPRYMGERLHTDRFIGEITKYIEGTVIKLRTLSPEQFLEMRIDIPSSFEEQERIGALFEILDYLTDHYQHKLDTLKNYKKAMLAKMFPREGQTVPEIRFEGFTGEWERHKLADLVEIYDGIHQTPHYTNTGIMFLSVENISTLESEKFISEEAFTRDYRVYPQKGDVLMTRIGDVGTTNVVETSEKLAFYVSLALLKPKRVDSYYLCNVIQSPFFKKGLRDRTLITAIPQKINKDEIGKIDILVPTLKTEQQQIGGYFKQLDSLITLHQRKLDKLKDLKKGMLNKMFVKGGN